MLESAQRNRYHANEAGQNTSKPGTRSCTAYALDTHAGHAKLEADACRAAEVQLLITNSNNGCPGQVSLELLSLVFVELDEASEEDDDFSSDVFRLTRRALGPLGFPDD